MSKNLIIIASVAVIIALVLFICNKPAPSRKGDAQQVERLTSDANTLIKEANRRILMHVGREDSLKQQLAEVRKQNEIADLNLTRAEKSAAAAVAQLRISRARKDTVAVYKDSEVLETRTEELINEVDSLQTRSRIVENNLQLQVAEADTARAIAWNDLNTLKRNYDTLHTYYKAIYIDYSKLQKKNKFTKAVAKGGVVATLILGTLLYFNSK